MAGTSSRALQLLSLLQTHRYWAGTELAERLEVSLRTLRRDVDRLRELGYPVQAQRGVDGGYQLAPGASLPPLVLDDEEAVALAVGLMAAAQSSVTGTAESSMRALAKVVQVMPNRLRHQAEAMQAMIEPTPGQGIGTNVDPQTLTLIAQACRDSERLQFDYTAVSGTQQRRHTEPHRMVSLGRRWYLVAYDLDRHDWRTFRLDRLGALERTGARFAPRTLPAPDAATFVRQGLTQVPAAYTVEALIHAPPDSVRDRVGRWASVEEAGDGSSLMRMRTDSFDWPAMVLGNLGAEFSVIGPPEMLDYLAEWTARFARATAAEPRPDFPAA
ncbi:MAG TPA: YafY family protein [Frankiaceae bacterium]|jgi:predicted DNA-binding transcriptional regulator YafY|nr:YafY family protein [Frankiaceae bacterium]